MADEHKNQVRTIRDRFHSFVEVIRDDRPEHAAKRDVVALTLIILGIIAFLKPTPFTYLWSVIRWDITSSVLMILVGVYFVLRYIRD